MENDKIKTREEISIISEELKKDGKVIVSANGSFDILHIGHVKFLREAKEQGDILIIGLNTDDSVRRWKEYIGYQDWKERPINNEKDRAEVLSALRCVDYITLFDETDCIKFVDSVKPNIHVNGSEHGENCIESETVRKYGGKIHIVKLVGDYSTSNIINKLKKMED